MKFLSNINWLRLGKAILISIAIFIGALTFFSFIDLLMTWIHPLAIIAVWFFGLTVWCVHAYIK
jgi:hypothetical protein